MKAWQELFEEYDEREERYWNSERSSDDVWRAVAVCLDNWPHDANGPILGPLLPLRRGVRLALASRYGDINSARFAFRHLLLELTIEWARSDNDVTPDHEDVAECLYAVGFGNASFDRAIVNVGKRPFIEVLRQVPVGDRDDRDRWPWGAHDNLLLYSAHLTDKQIDADEEYLRTQWSPGIDPLTFDYFMERLQRDEQTLDIAFHLAELKKKPKPGKKPGGRPASDDGRNLRIAWLEHRRRKQIEFAEGALESEPLKALRAREARIDLLAFIAQLDEKPVIHRSQRTVDGIYTRNLARVELLWTLLEQSEKLQGTRLANIKSLTRNPFDRRNRDDYPLKPPTNERPN